jgi:hypothetical protein
MSVSINVGVFNVLAGGISTCAKSKYSDPDKIYEILKAILIHYKEVFLREKPKVIKIYNSLGEEKLDSDILKDDLTKKETEKKKQQTKPPNDNIKKQLELISELIKLEKGTLDLTRAEEKEAQVKAAKVKAATVKAATVKAATVKAATVKAAKDLNSSDLSNSTYIADLGKVLKDFIPLDKELNLDAILSQYQVLKNWMDTEDQKLTKIKTIRDTIMENFNPVNKEGVGKALKEISELFEISLYGGFRLGNISSLSSGNFIKLISTEDFQTEFYIKKWEFIKDRITNFFKSETDSGHDGDILICPEFDYFCPSNKDFERDFSDELKPLKVTYKKMGSYITDSYDTKTSILTNFEDGKPIANMNSNQFRVIFYKTKLNAINKELSCTVVGTNVERMDIIKFEKFNLISVHLKSTTAISKKDLEVKQKNINNILTATKLLNGKPTIIAGDFNFPIFQKKANGNYKTIKGFHKTNYDDDDTGNFEGLSDDDKQILYDWTKFLMKMDVTTESMENDTTGVCLKERFIETRGNDQSFVGKGDKRAYNTDFIGLYDKDRSSVNIGQSYNKIVDISNRKDMNILCPYVALNADRTINVQESWLSDHSMIMRNITVEEVYEGFGDDTVLLSSGPEISTQSRGGSRKKRRKKTKKKNSSRKKTKRKRSKRKSSKRSKSKKNKKKTTKK